MNKDILQKILKPRHFLTFTLLCFFCSLSFFSLLAADSPFKPEVESSVSKLINTTANPSKMQSNQDFLAFRDQLRILGFLTVISLLPFGVMMLTSFTRISIIFHFLRQALGYQQVPSNQIVIGLSLILTAFIMHPVIRDVQKDAIEPYLEQSFKSNPEVLSGQKTEEMVLMEKGWAPLRNFLMRHTREKDLMLFLDIAHVQLPQLHNEMNFETFGQSSQDLEIEEGAYDVNAIPWYCLIPSFVMSELRLAFMMGFLLFLPFLIIDMVVASILMSMGMMMLPPVLVSTPFKLLLFILIDGWRLIIQQIVSGFMVT